MFLHQTNKILIGAICWILTSEYFLVQFIVQTAWPSYNIFTYDVSDLGITSCGVFIDPLTKLALGYMCSPLHAVMNAGVILLGIFILLGVWLARKSWPRSRKTRTGLILVGLSGIGEIFSGAFPVNTIAPLHAFGALLHWICGSIGIIFLGFVLRSAHKRLFILSLFCGIIGIVGFFLYGNHVYLGIGRGGMERLTAYPLEIWIIVLGISLFKNKTY